MSTQEIPNEMTLEEYRFFIEHGHMPITLATQGTTDLQRLSDLKQLNNLQQLKEFIGSGNQVGDFPITKAIKMPPFAKERSRFNGKAKGRKKAYMTSQYRGRKAQLRQAWGGQIVLPDGFYAKLSVTAVRPIPLSWSKKRKAEALGKYAKPKPDLDNIIGAVMDALFEEDDLVVAFGPCQKIWGHEAQIIITVELV